MLSRRFETREASLLVSPLPLRQFEIRAFYDRWTPVMVEAAGATLQGGLVKRSADAYVDPETSTLYLAELAGVAPGDPANVSVDANGYLHLNVTDASGSWTAAEVFSSESLGFGTYQWQIGDGPVKTFKPGEAFYEPPGVLHAVSRNASSTGRAKIVVFMVADAKQPSTVVESEKK